MELWKSKLLLTYCDNLSEVEAEVSDLSISK